MFTCFKNIFKPNHCSSIFIKESIKENFSIIMTPTLQEEEADNNDWGFYVVLDQERDYLKNHMPIINYTYYNQKYRNTIPTIQEYTKTTNNKNNTILFKKPQTLCTIIVTMILTFIILNI